MTAKNFCANCDAETLSNIVRRQETFSVRGEAITANSNVRVCAACGEEMFDEELDAANLERFFSIYRERHRLIGPERIRALRERYGLSQRSLAALLGMGEVTIHRYESGSLPEQSQSLLLELVEAPENMKRVLETHGDRLSPTIRRKLMARLDDLQAVTYPDWGTAGASTPGHGAAAPLREAAVLR